MKDIIKEILKESENEFDWIPELREVVVTNPGLRYPTHLEAMVALGVTGAKEFIDKFGIYYFNTEEFHKWRQEHSYHYGDDLFFSENTMYGLAENFVKMGGKLLLLAFLKLRKEMKRI